MLKRVAALAAPCLLVLTGCGVTDTVFHPGVAAEVGDRTVTNNEVDELTTRYCAAVEDQIADSGQRIPLGGFKIGITAQLAMEDAAEQLAEDYGIEPSDDYLTQRAGFVQQGKDIGLTGDDLDAYVEVQSSQAKVVDLLTQIGAVELEAEGEDDPTIDFQQARGQDELEVWVEREGVVFDPRYGLEMVEGAPQASDTDITVAVGDVAVAAQAQGGEPDPTFLAALPASATCG